ncbi:hypothetical protein [Parabacteroides johnsonii]
MDSLRRLPVGAIYTSRRGRATASARRISDTLYIEANCDSLIMINYQLQERLDRLQQQQAQNNTVREPATATFWDRLKTFSAGMMIGIILTIITKFIYKLWQNRK